MPSWTCSTYFPHIIFTGERFGKKRWLYPIGSPSQRKWVRKHIRQVHAYTHERGLRTADVLGVLGGMEEDKEEEEEEEEEVLEEEDQGLQHDDAHRWPANQVVSSPHTC